MKKLLIAMCLSVAFFAARAQSIYSYNPGGVYIKGGFNFSNISTTPDGQVNNANSLTTFNVGLIGDVPLASMFSFQTGLVLNGAGAQTQSPNYNVKFNPLYLQIPVNFVVKLPVDRQTGFFVGAGPYVEMGVGGKTTGTSTFDGATTVYSKNIVYSDNNNANNDATVNELNRFDVGANFLAGVEVHRVMFGLNYQLGLTKINADQQNTNDKNKYRIFSLDLGVRL